MAPRYFASEFPNDNPDLHAGAVWVVRTPCAPPEPELTLDQTQPIVIGRSAAPRPVVVAAPEVTQVLSVCAARTAPAVTPGETTLEALLTEGPEVVEAPLVVAHPAEADATPVDPTCAVAPTLELPDAEVEETAAHAEEPAEPEVVEPAAHVETPAPPLESIVAPASHAAEDLLPLAEFAGAPAPLASHVRITDDASADDEAPPSEPVESVGGASADPFRAFVEALVAVAGAADLSIEVEALVALLGEGRADRNRLPESAASGLVEANLATHEGATLRLTDAFALTARTWRAILREEDADFAACGSRMLDEWAADLLARLLNTPAKADALRRELRAHGVAAFGLLAA